MTPVLTAGGYVVTDVEITVSAKVQGKIESLHVREGQVLEQGQIIATLENEEIKTELEQVEVRLQSAVTDLKLKQELLKRKVRELERQRRLQKERLVSQSELESAEQQYFLLSLDVERAKSEIEACEKQLQLKKIHFKETYIRAPMAGTVLSKKADVGEMLFPRMTMEGKSGSAIVTLADLNTLNVEIDINEDDIGKIALGCPVEVTPDAFPDRAYKGEVIEIAPMADRQKNVIPIKVRIRNSDAYLKPELSAKVIFLKQASATPAKEVLTIPKEAVTKKENKTYVFIIENGRAIQRQVALGEERGTFFVVAQGLKEGEKVIIKGHTAIKNGDSVSLD